MLLCVCVSPQSSVNTPDQKVENGPVCLHVCVYVFACVHVFACVCVSVGARQNMQIDCVY